MRERFDNCQSHTAYDRMKLYKDPAVFVVTVRFVPTHLIRESKLRRRTEGLFL